MVAMELPYFFSLNIHGNKERRKENGKESHVDELVVLLNYSLIRIIKNIGRKCQGTK